MLDNAGLGLFFIREIATRAGGGFFLGSGDALVDLWGNLDGTPGRKYITSRNDGWPGTFAVLQLRRDRIDYFDGLLARCRELAAEARRDDTEVSLDFVDDIPDVDGAVVVNVQDFNENVEAAARIRDDLIAPAIRDHKLTILDFKGISFATQSFVHALMYKLIRDRPETRAYLTLARASDASKEAIRAVAAYARTASDTH